MSVHHDIEAIRKECHDLLGRFPTLQEAYMDYYHATYAPGALEAKTKHLLALCGALVSGCHGCIVGQAERAVEKGATPQEILETCLVAISLGGTMAWTQTARVMHYLKDEGLLD
ncbi:MAG: carboxymuconolactone decarboxylase family protein [Desulfovibrio sp.]|nr:MAG: carboxymuconolactone decarboxylase family protein [Desulfovibrio sp.]